MISVSIDTRALSKDLSALEKSQLPFAVMKTLNELAEGVQLEEQEHIARRFMLRRPTWVMNTIKIERRNFATKDNLRAIVNIDPDRDVLSKFEDDGQKTARFAGHNIAVPQGATRNKQDIVPQFARPKAFMLNDPTGTGDSLLGKGKKRTFLVRDSKGRGLLLQRIGKRSKFFGKGAGRDPNVKLLWLMVPKVKLPRNLLFVQNATSHVQKNYHALFEKWLKRALATAK